MEILNRFEVLVQYFKNPTIFEVGINDGYHTNILNQIIKKYHQKYVYYAFEPDYRLIAQIEYIIAAHPQIVFFDHAVSDIIGEIDFHLSGGYEKRPNFPKQNFTGSSSIRKPKEVLKAWPDMTFETVKVQTITMDEIIKIRNISKIDFVWMDTQGAEIDVFRGAKESLKKIQYIYTEYCDAELYEGEIGLKEICNLLPMFEIVEDYGGDVLLRNKEIENV
jgi:FkbM family methyltransferase